MIQKINKIGAYKFGIYFLYVCAQILILASLLLTNTSIAAHIVFMLLAIVGYFLTAFKDPGVYVGIVQPNMEDIQQSKSKVQKQKTDLCRQYASQKQCYRSKQVKKQMVGQKKQEKKREVQSQDKSQVKQQIIEVKKTSLQQIEAQFDKKPNGHTKNIENLIPQKKKPVESSKNKVIEVTKAVFGNITNFFSKKKVQIREDHNEQKNNQNIKTQQVSLKLGQKDIKQQNNNIQQNSKIEQSDHSTQKQKGVNSAADKEDFDQQQISRQFRAQDIKIELNIPASQPRENKSMSTRLSQIKRYCRICQSYQPLRVKHCHSCNKCFGTYDHHCPWLATCISQKNKVFFIGYLFFQTIQLFAIVIGLARSIANDQTSSSASAGILLMAILLFFIVITIILSFHIYLIAKNITTWELLRWQKIQYLNIFDKQKVSSPFDKGIKANLKQFWEYSRSTQLKNWTEEVRQDISKCMVRKQRLIKKQIQILDSDRRPFRSQKVI